MDNRFKKGPFPCICKLIDRPKKNLSEQIKCGKQVSKPYKKDFCIFYNLI